MMESGSSPNAKQGTRVFKKSSPNGKITTYLCKRDFIGSLTQCDPIEGVVLVDPDYVKDRKVFTHVLAAFRYGREDLDVLGLTFRKDLYLASTQVYPCVQDSVIENGSEPVLVNPPVIVATTAARDGKTVLGRYASDEVAVDEEVYVSRHRLTRLQERLIKKLGNNAYPFFFQLPQDAPASVMLQPGPNESGKPCGVDYELRTYVADGSDDKLQKRNSVRLAIRKLTYAPEEPAPQPSAVIVKDFLMSPGSLRLEVSLDKEKYYHGESIAVNVLVDNNSNKTVKKAKLSVRQHTELCLHNSNRYSCVVDELETEESFPILPSQTGWCKVYRLRPLLSNNRHKRGLALDGKLKHEDTNLASSTIICNPQQKENLGMIVQYRVKVRLVLGFGASDVSLELPFTLTHPKPVAESEDAVLKIHEMEENLSASQGSLSPSASPAAKSASPLSPLAPYRLDPATDSSPVDLITLSGQSSSPLPPPSPVRSAPPTNHVVRRPEDDDDLIFEDFARLRLKASDVQILDQSTADAPPTMVSGDISP